MYDSNDESWALNRRMRSILWWPASRRQQQQMTGACSSSGWVIDAFAEHQTRLLPSWIVMFPVHPPPPPWGEGQLRSAKEKMIINNHIHSGRLFHGYLMERNSLSGRYCHALIETSLHSGHYMYITCTAVYCGHRDNRICSQFSWYTTPFLFLYETLSSWWQHI